MNRNLRLRQAFKVCYITLSLSLFSLLSLGQTILLSDGFETGLQTNNWTVANYTPNSGSWLQYSFTQNTGSYSAGYYPNNINANSWLFTKALHFTQGKYYQLKYYAKVDINTSFQSTLSTSTTYSAPKTTIRNTYIPSYPFNLITDTIVAESTNDYYIGFQNYSAASQNSTASYIDDVEITELNLPACAVVNAGTIAGSSANICPNVPFTLTGNNATINTQSIKYSWQKSTDNINWVNITNGFTYQKNITVSQVQPTYYRHVDTCITSGLSSISNFIQVTNTSYLNCYCTPSPINCFGSQTFTNIKINNGVINNTSTCINNGYGNYTGLPAATTYRNQNVVVQHTISNPNNFSYYIGIWIDYDQNGVFDQNEFTINGPFTSLVNTSQITIPNTALLGQTRIRIQAKAYFSVNPLPYNYTEACTGTGQTGETEDYLLNIAVAPNCTGPVSAGSVTSSVTQICPNNNFTITATGTSTNTGQMRYAWQKSTDNLNWTNVTNTGYLINPLTISQNITSFYRLTDTCIASGTTAISNIISVNATNLFNCYCVPNNTVCSAIGIDTVRFNTINNGSPICPTGGYSNFTALSTSVNNGSYVPIYIKLKNNTTNPKYADVYIDFNRNGTFTTDEKAFSGTGMSVITGDVYIPYNVNAGPALMRVVAGYTTSSSACINSFNTGETEDYTVNLNLTSPAANHFCFYVNKLATGLNNGTSWSNAFTDLSSAFNLIRVADTVKVAQGTYTAGPVNTSSLVLKDSVTILGGYPNAGNPSNAQRNFSQYPTIISGEIGSPALLTDNTKIILQSANTKGSLVDGFIIEKGYDWLPNTGAGPIGYNLSVGTIQNTVIRNNYNNAIGSGINIRLSDILIKNCVFEKDSSWASTDPASSIINAYRSTVNVQNTVFAKCKTPFVFNVNNSNFNITNSTVFKNWGNSYIHDTSNVQIKNSIFYYNGNNYLKDTAEFEKDVYSSLSIQNTITEVYTHPTYNGQNPKFADTANIAGTDNLYFTADDGLSLLNPCSPGINAGNNSLSTNIVTDITGNPRIANTVIDLGAYEVQAPIAAQPPVMYVNKTATGLNNGTSWANAFTDLQAALYRCSDTVKVAMGTYTVSDTDKGASFTLSNNRVIIGGYPNTGNPTNAQYNPITNPTRLSGQVTANTYSPIVLCSNGNDSTAKISGFEIINSAPPFGAGFYYINYGALKISNNSSPYLESIQMNCAVNGAMKLALITNGSKPKIYKSSFFADFNAANYDIVKPVSIDRNSSPVFLKCYIGKDTAATGTFSYKGAAFVINNANCKFDSCYFNKSIENTIQNLNGANTIIQNSRFKEVNGRSVFNDNSTAIILNCTFFENAPNIPNLPNPNPNPNPPIASSYGVIQNSNNSFLNVNNSIFLDSYCAVRGGVCQNDNSTATFKNSFFKNPRAGYSGGAFYNVKGAVNIINCASYLSDISSYSNPQGQFAFAEDSAQTTIINATILSNSFNSVSVLATGTNCTLKFYNSIIWRYGEGQIRQNADQDIVTVNNNSASVCDIRNSVLYKQTNTLTSNTLIGIDPKLLNLTTAKGADNTLLTADDGLTLCTCSPAINMGNNALNNEASDLINNNRIFGSVIDAGAYELQQTATTNKSYFVKANASTNGTGTSWSNAYNKLQTAVLNNCADTVKVAKGIYKASFADRDSSFNIYRGITMQGGYPDSGNPTDADRNTITNPSVISGDIGIANDSTDNTNTLIYIHCPDTTVTIDGFTIERATNSIYPGVGIFGGGGAIKTMGNYKVYLNNLIIKKNYAYTGGGIYSWNTNLNANKCVLDNNFSPNSGAFYIQNAYTVVNNNPYNPTLSFKNSVFCNNKGGAVTIGGFGFGAINNFDNVIVYNNEGPFPGFYLPDNGNVNITNSLFAKNNKTSYYPGIDICVTSPYYGNPLKTYVNNTIFYNSTLFGGQSQYANDNLNWQVSTTFAEPIPYGHLNYSILSSSAQTTGGGIGLNHSVIFRDYNNPMGNDGIWMTADDGLQVTPCSDNIDHGSNLYVQNIPTDILAANRIINTTVDIGPYEANSTLPIVPTATITASDTTICTGASILFTAVVTGANSTTTYQWKRNGINVGNNQANYYSNNFSNNDVVYVQVTINNPCVTTQNIISNSQTIHVSNSLAATVSITSSSNPACAGSTITYTATASNAGNNATYQWKKNGINAGSNLNTFTANNINNNDIISVVLTSSITCVSNSPVTSNSIVQIINSNATPTISIAGNTNICTGVNNTFTATITNGGTVPIYQWQVNGINAGTNSNTFTTNTLANNAQVKCILTSNSACVSTVTASSNTIVMTVNPSVTPMILINTPSATTCQGGAISFTATTTNAGSSPIFQWQVNGINAGANAPSFTSSALNNNDQITCIFTGNALCAATANATSNTVTVVVTAAVNPNVSIVSNSTTACLGTSVSFIATPTNGGPTPTYQWKVNGINAGTNSPTFITSSLQNNDEVNVIMTGSLTCATQANTTSNTITMSVTPVPVANAGNDLSICAGSSTQLSGSGGTIFSWSPAMGLSNTNIANPIATPAATTLYVLTVSNGSCSSTDNVLVTVSQPATPSVSITSSNNNICVGSNATFTALALNAGPNPTYQWQVNGINVGTNNPTFATNSLQNNAQIKVAVTSSGCTTTPIVTSNIITMNVTTLTQPIVSLNTNILSVTNADAAAAYTWQVLSNTVWINVTPTVTGLTYTVTQPGEYRVKAEKGLCVLYSATQVSARSNTLDSTLIYIYLHPNPTRGLITVYKIEPSQKWQSLEVINVQGMIILPSVNIRGLRSVPINVSNFAPSLYFVRLTKDDGRVITFKFIKE